jgi:hypothetical protein
VCEEDVQAALVELLLRGRGGRGAKRIQRLLQLGPIFESLLRAQLERAVRYRADQVFDDDAGLHRA